MTKGNRLRDEKSQVLIMRTPSGFYPIEASGKKALAEEAHDHGILNVHVTSIEDIDGNTLWRRHEF